jgi:hypothetical protein
MVSKSDERLASWRVYLSVAKKARGRVDSTVDAKITW